MGQVNTIGLRPRKAACLAAENARLYRLLDEAGVNAERAFVLVAEGDEERRREVDAARAEAAAARDATRRAREDGERQRLLMAELGHRLKNTLALVQAVVNQTLRGQGSAESAREALNLRLAALWRVHEVLLHDNWTGATVAAVVGGTVDLHGDERRPERFVVEGDAGVHLDARAALGLGLALHELATNAAKYGALSTERGHVRIACRVSGDATGAGAGAGASSRLDLRWSEHGGPPVDTAPTRRGFGSKLIERSLAGAGGSAHLAYEPTGVACALTLPLLSPRAV